MNRIYRLVFNRALGLMQVASEVARPPRGGGAGVVGHLAGTLRPVSFGVWLALGWVGWVLPATGQQAQDGGRIVSDPNAPGSQRPTVITAANGVPVVNITTPSRSGVSRNVYRQFDVGTEGAILNNARGDVQTQLGGWIQGNPWLATGAAKVILNEINGNDPSRLRGYLEVAGQRAEVVIANPAGILVDGAGFLNASRVTLTTGVPIVTGGALEGYRVEQGAIRVEGAGLDATQADYTDLITRSLQVNAGIWANQLQASLGTNVVSADHTGVASVAGSGDAPTFALDVGALGGMYANKIWLVGNEHGVGVRNAGKIGAQAGELVVTIDGRLENVGLLQSQQDTRVAATDGIVNSGTISAGRELQLRTDADLDNSAGTINAQRLDVEADALRNRAGSIEQVGVQTLAIQAAQLLNRDQGSIGALARDTGTGNGDVPTGDNGSSGGGNGDGTGTGGTGTGGTTGSGNPGSGLLAEGRIAIGGELDNSGGTLVAGGDIDARSQYLDNSGGSLTVRDLHVDGAGLDNRAGTLAVQRTLALEAGRLDNRGGRLDVAQTLQARLGQLDNRDGQLLHGGRQATVLQVEGRLDNSDGTLASNADTLRIEAAHLLNEDGKLQHAGTGLNVQVDRLDGQDGHIATAGSLDLRAGQVDHRNATLSAERLDMAVQGFDNRGGMVIATGTQANTLAVRDTLDNGGGTLASNGDLSISAATFGNAGGTVQQAGKGALTIDATTLEGQDGTLVSNGDLAISGDTTDLRNGTTSAQRIAIDTGNLTTAGGQLVATGSDALRLQVRDTFDNNEGTVATNGALWLDAGSLSNRGGTVQAAGKDDTRFTVTGALDNTGGSLTAAGNTRINATDLYNAGGSVQAAGTSTLQISVDGVLDNSTDGQLASGGDMTLEARKLDNTAGHIEHAGDGQMAIRAEVLNGQRGTIAGNGVLTITGHTTDLGGGSTSAQRIAVDTGNLTTAGGQLVATGSDVLRLQVRDTFDNNEGTVATNGTLWLDAGSLSNRGGTVQNAGKGDSHLVVRTTLDNSDGTLASNADTLRIEAAHLLNEDGKLQHAGTGLNVQVDRLDGQDGHIATAGSLDLRAGQVDHRNATLSADRLDVDAQRFDNRGGTVIATGTQANTLAVRDTLDNGGGTLASNGDLSISAATFGNAGGTVQQAGKGALTIDATTLEGQDGTLVSNGDLAISGDTTDLRNGTTSAQRIAIDTGNLTTAGGQLVATGSDALRLQVRDTFDNNEGTVATNGALWLDAGSLSNRGGTVQAAGKDDTRFTVTGALDNTGGSLTAAGNTRINATDLYNAGGSVQAAGTSTLQISVDGVLDNSTDGQLASGGDMTLEAAVLDNRGGRIEHAGSGGLHVSADTVRGIGGSIISNGALELGGENIDLRDGSTVAQRITVDAGNLTTAGGQLVATGSDALRLQVRDTFDNNEGTVATNGALWLDAGSLSNRGGTVQNAGKGDSHLAVRTALDNSGGTLASNADTLRIEAAHLLNEDGKLQHAGTGLNVQVDRLDGQDGHIATAGSLDLRAGQVDHRNATLSAERLDMAVQGFDNRGGMVIATGTQANTLAVRDTLDNGGGTLASNGDLSISAATFGNAGGTVQQAGKGALTIDATTLEGQDGTLVSNGDLAISGDTTDLRNGTTSAQRIAIDTGNLTTAGGQLIATGSDALRLQVRDTFDNNEGTVATNGALWLDAGSLSNRGGTVQNAGKGDSHLVVRTTLDNGAGVIASNADALRIEADHLLNEDGAISHAGSDLSLQVDRLDGQQGSIATAGSLHLQAGQVDHRNAALSAGHLDVDAQRFDNRGGTVIATGTQANTLAVSDTLDNGNGGTLASNGDLSITASTFGNAGGTVQQAGAGMLSIDATALNGPGGTLLSNGDLTITGNTTDLRDGTTSAHRIAIDTGSLTTAGGQLIATGSDALRLQVRDHFDNVAGIVATNGALLLDAGMLSNRAGSFQAAGNGDTRLTVGGLLDNTGGTLAAAGNTRITAADLRNAGGALQAAGTSTLQVSVDGVLDNGADGLIASGGDLILEASTLDNTDGRIEHAGDGLLAIRAETLNGQHGTIAGNGALTISGDTTDLGGGTTIAQRIAIDTGNLTTAKGQLIATGSDALRLQVRDHFDNDAGTVATNGALWLDAGTLSNRGGTVQNAGNGDSHLIVRTTLDNSAGTLASNADHLRIEANRLLNEAGELQHAGTDMSVQVDRLDGQQGSIATAGNLHLQAGQVDHRNATLSAERLDVDAQRFDNRGGTVIATGAEANALVVRDTLDNSDGGALASNGDLSITASTFGNAGGVVQQAGAGMLSIDATTLHGQGGTLVSNGDLTITGGTTDLRDGITSAQRIAIDTGNLTTAGGQLVATGSDALRLQVRNIFDNAAGSVATNGALLLDAGTLSNRGGTVQAAGSGNTRLTVEGVLDNSGGTLLASGNTAIAAGTLDNHGGTLHAAGTSQLRLDVDGLLDNHDQGVLSGGEVLIAAASLDNRTGVLAAAGAMEVVTQAGIGNAAGLIQAGKALRTDSQGLGNAGGTLVGGTLQVETHGKALDNASGTIASQEGALDIASGLLHNIAGRVQSAGDLKIDTSGQLLDNRQSGATGGIVSSGRLDIASGAIDNRAGVVFARGDAQLKGSIIDNTLGGSLTTASSLTLAGASLSNAGGIVQADRNATLKLGGNVDNRAGLIGAGGTLTLTASAIDNRNTRNAGNAALGLQAGNLQLDAQSLDNRLGQILTDGSAHIVLAGRLDNAGGQIVSGGDVDIRADTVDNLAGLLLSGNDLSLETRDLSGDGQLLSQRDLTLDLQQDFSNTGELTANGTLTLLTSGNLDNRGKLQAGGVHLRASHIDNAAGAEIDSIGLTHLEAGSLVNRGLIDGGVTHIEATSVDNLGTGRIYGDHVAIAADTLRNIAEARGGATKSATIAARQELDIGVRTLENSGQSLIYSDRDAAIGGRLDAARRAVGSAARIDNLGSTIDIAGNLDISATAINNIRQDVVIDQSRRTEAPVRLNQPGWRNNGANATNNIRSTSNYDAFDVYYLHPDDILQDTAYVTPDGLVLHEAVIRLTPQTSAYFFARGGLYAARGERSRLNAQDGTVTIYYFSRQDGQANPDQRGTGGQDPFADLAATQAGGPAFAYVDDNLAFSSAYGTCSDSCVRLVAQHDYDPRSTLMYPHRGGDLGSNEQYRIATRTVTEDVLVSAGADAIIHAGGRMRIASDSLRNEYGRIAAGGDLAITGLSRTASVTNIGHVLYTTYSFSNVSHRYNGSTEYWSNPSISVETGRIGGSITSGGTLTVDVGDLSNLNRGRNAPNVQDGLGTSNLEAHGPGSGPQGPAAPQVRGPARANGVQAGGVAGDGAQAVANADAGEANAASDVRQVQAGGAGQASSALPQEVRASQGVAGQGSAAHAPDAVRQVGGGDAGGSALQDVQGRMAGHATAAAPDSVQDNRAQTGNNLHGPDAVSGTTAVRAADASPDAIVMGAVNTHVPSSSLFNVVANGNGPLVETDPRFADHRTWLDSDWLLRQMGVDPASVHKRLGDGFYEQKLVREQIGQLTGRRFLEGYASDEAQYRALLEAGATFAEAYGLRPGVALSAEQMAQLTSDIVWLVEQTVTLADGSTTTALVPQVYLRVRPGDLADSGALLAGTDVDLRLGGDLVNSGDIAGRQRVRIEAENIANQSGASISGQNVGLQARQDIHITGSSVTAGEALALVAGGDITVASTLQTQQGAGFDNTVLDRVAGLYVTGGSGGLTVAAGNDLTLLGAQVNNAGSGLTALAAGNDLTLAALEQSRNQSITGDAGNFQHVGQVSHVVSGVQGAGNVVLQAGTDLTLQAANVQAGSALAVQAGRDLVSTAVTDVSTLDTSQTGRRSSRAVSALDETVHGTVLQAGGDIALVAGRDATLTAAGVYSQDGGIALSAGRDVNLLAAQEQHDLTIDEQRKKKGLFSSKTTTTHDEWHESLAVGTTLSGESVQIAAGRDLTAQGAQIAGTGDVLLAAGRDLTLTTAENTYSESHDKTVKKSGLFSGGGIGFTIGKQRTDTESDIAGVTHAGSTVGSLEGDVTLVAGNTLSITGSDVLALEGDIIGKAKSIEIAEVHDTSTTEQQTRFKQSGLTVAVSAPVLSVLQTADDLNKASKQSGGDGRMQALAAGAAALNAYNSAGALSELGQGLASGNAADMAKGANVSISATIGGSKSESQSTQSSSTTKGSTLQAGGDVTLLATGGGQGSNIVVRGSDISAGNDLLLLADSAITLESAQDTAKQHSSSKSSSAAIGVAANIGSSGTSFGVTASASAARGNADGEDVIQRNTHVSAGNTATIISGGDTMLKGAQLSAERVLADIGGDLNIESLQDTSTYDSKNKSMGGSVTVGAGFSGSASYSSSNVSGDYASVAEQSGIFAGDGGFDIRVEGNTDLKGALIASTQDAVDAGANRLQTGTITTSDIENHSDYSAKGMSLSGGYSMGGKKDGDAGSPSTTNKGADWSWQNFNTGAQGAAAGYGSKSGSDSSTTISGISGGTVVITDVEGQQARTGQSAEEVLAGLNREVLSTDDANGLSKTWDGQKLQQQVEAQAQITAVFGQQASKAVGDFASRKALELRLQGNEEEAAKWDEGGAYRVAAHAVMGALGGGLEGALGSGSAAAAAPYLTELTSQLPDGVKEAVGAGLAAGLGAALGGGAGASMAFNEDANNRMLHPEAVKWIREHASEFAEQQGISEQEAYRILLVEGAAYVDQGVQDKLAQLGSYDNEAAIEFLLKNQEIYGNLAALDGDYRGDATMFANELGRSGREFVDVFNALAATAGTKDDWHSVLAPANNAFADASASQWGVAKLQAGSAGLGVTAALGQTALVFCRVSPATCQQLLVDAADGVMAEYTGGHALATTVGAGAAAGAAAKAEEALKAAAAAEREAAMAMEIVNNSVGFAPGVAKYALEGMRGGGGHAIRRLEGSLIPSGGSLQSRVDAFIDIATPILERPVHTANWRIGVTEGRAFLGVVDGKNLVIVVAKDGPYSGKVISAFFPDKNQLNLILSR